MTHLECARCGATRAATALINLCSCGGVLYPRYDLARLLPSPLRATIESGPRSLWCYRSVLPVAAETDEICLGEGFTPRLPGGD